MKEVAIAHKRNFRMGRIRHTVQLKKQLANQSQIYGSNKWTANINTSIKTHILAFQINVKQVYIEYDDGNMPKQ